jgi:plastocyanin
MKTIILIFSIAFTFVGGLNAQIAHTITESGFAYSPAELTIAPGDTVKFVGTVSHPIQEVSEETWTNSGITPLAGGFAFAGGSGTVVFPNAGVHYYVCTAHVSLGMKGKIIVGSPTAVSETELKETSLYPVPLSGNILTLNLKKPAEELFVTVYDLAGNTRITERGSASDGTYQLNCLELPKGLYLLRMQTGESSAVVKFTRD